ncbi:iron-containing alcohol dehydrogenase [Gordonia hankookensis]|uniref:Iron-containing alcohol dehydrogenase n=1 Tax=Gordonia hankookensis TaxID=589403 RepID=A0ABR7WFB6_9ACTN|nr:iron-containing alcohol dehydrogenase [Gordonia hankookensis]MBD1321473.1 iron-containing alcohol dehydrogenase [Gordonia hankookensis]
MSAALDGVGVERAARRFAAPQQYVQGPGVFDELGPIVAEHGARPVVVIDADIVELLGERLTASMALAGLTHQVVPYRGPVTRAHIATTVDRVATGFGDVVVGVGGGKALDVAKGVAHRLGRPMISVPTTASNDGPTASIYALYDDEGRLSELGRLPSNPAAVVVDTKVIATAPIRFLVSGIGDALSKKFEARSCARGRGVTTQGTRPLIIGEVIADGCSRVLLRDGVAAVRDVIDGRVTAEVEAVVEAVILLSGIGYENGGLSIAHCMTRGLQVGRGSSKHLHGFHVAYGLLVQLALEDDPEVDRREIRDFLTAVGLPTSLADLDMPSPTSQEIAALGAAAAAAPHAANTWVDASATRITAAIDAVERQVASDGD